MIGWNNVKLLVEVNPQKSFVDPNLSEADQNQGPELGFLLFSQVWLISFPL